MPFARTEAWEGCTSLAQRPKPQTERPPYPAQKYSGDQSGNPSSFRRHCLKAYHFGSLDDYHSHRRCDSIFPGLLGFEVE